MTAVNQPATKQDIEEIFTRLFPKFFKAFQPAFDLAIDKAIETKIEPMVQRIVGDTVGEIVGDALQVISERFDRLEPKLDEARDIVDYHTIDIRKLQRKIAQH